MADESYVLVKTEGAGYVVFGPVASTWKPSRGAVISVHKTYGAAYDARKRQEKKK